MSLYEKVDVIKLAEMKCEMSGKRLQDYSEKEAKYGNKIIENCIQEIKEEIPALIPVINIFKLFPVKLPIPISTDYSRLFYNPKKMIELKKDGLEYEIRNEIMHIIIHGLLGDNIYIKNEKKNKVLWLILDQRVDDICFKLGYMDRESERNNILEKMKNKEPYSSCFANYYLAKNNGKVRKNAGRAWKSIASDNHYFWYPEYVKNNLGISVSDAQADDKAGSERKDLNATGLNNEELSNEEMWKNVRELFLLGTEANERTDARNKAITKAGINNANSTKNLELLIKNLKYRFSGKKAGIGSANFENIVEVSKGEAGDYKEIIRNLLAQIEDSKEQMDSIDPMMYQYGLDMYGDVLLIEPREDNELPRCNTICIAIDTSGSCCGRVAELFLREVQEIIREILNEAVDGKIMLIQCDYRIKKEEILNIKEFADREIKEKESFLGGGGTSFIPVFNRLDQYNHEEEKIDALIYLSDGCGIFPESEPDYPTIFIMTKEDMEYVTNIPTWIEVGCIT